jgi:rhodanese-related sulfurtransferase
VLLHLDDREVMVDAVVAAVGVEPDVELARSAGVRLGGTGAIAVDARLATSQPHVWAAGDCVEVRDAASGLPVFRPFGSLANRQGRTLANVLAGRDDVFPPVAGAVATQIFDDHVAAVGCTETRARSLGLLPRSVWISAPDRAEYWPEAELMHLKLVYERGSGRVLGVQAVGRGEVVKRIDVATQFVARGATIEDLGRLEHAYAPPFAPALEPLAVAAFAALNQEDGVEGAGPQEPLDDVLDVRLPEERGLRPSGASRCEEASLVELRNAPDRARAPGLVVCERGARAAEAARLLLDRGRPRYLGGGLAWRSAAGWGALEGEAEESCARHD